MIPAIEPIFSVLTELETKLKSLPSEVGETEGAIEAARTMAALRGIKDKVEETLKPFDAFYLHYKDVKLPAAFEAAGVPTINLEEGFRVTVSHAVRASVRGGKKEEAIAWLRANGLADIVSETVNTSTLAAVAKSMAEDNLELDTELFNVAVMPTTSVTKVKG